MNTIKVIIIILESSAGQYTTTIWDVGAEEGTKRSEK